MSCGAAGIAVYSRRAVPLAAWTAGLELANVVADPDRACLVLESGVSARWRYGNYRRTPENTADARAWEAAKIQARCGAAGVVSSLLPSVQVASREEDCWSSPCKA